MLCQVWLPWSAADSAAVLSLLRQVAVRWWALLLRDETLGRLVWIVENTLSTALLERS